MNRREMLLSLISLLGLSGTQILVSCQSSQDGPGPGDLLATSSSTSGHFHTFTITAEELASPVAISRADDSSGGHTHLVSLTLAEVTSIAAGTAVSTASGSSGGHTHTYTFQKA